MAMAIASASRSGLPACTVLEISDLSVFSSTTKSTAHLVLGVYQNAISPADGSNCTLSPSCSHYAVAANSQFGALKATVMSGSRVLKDHLDPALEKCIDSGGRVRLEHLPPATNQRWWAID